LKNRLDKNVDPHGRLPSRQWFCLRLLLPDSFKKPYSTFAPKWRVFNDCEIYFLQTRVLRDDPAKGKKKASIRLPAFKKAFSNWRLWLHFFISFANNGLQRGFDTYAPSLVSETVSVL
jgi:hypothetical protein